MKPKKFSPAHSNANLAEIVCSNSFKSNLHTNACGLLKEELRLLDSLLIKCADETSVPAGQALAVDREKFSELVTKKIKEFFLPRQPEQKDTDDFFNNDSDFQNVSTKKCKENVMQDPFFQDLDSEKKKQKVPQKEDFSFGEASKEQSKSSERQERDPFFNN